jgi:lysozyme family protein
MADYNKAFAELMECEGNWSNDKNDPGGLTRFGISSVSHPEVNLKTLTLDGAKAFYKAEYWDPARCGDIEDQELAEELFKAFVNMPPIKAVALLQGAINDIYGASPLTVDGQIGTKTIAAANTICNTYPCQVGAKVVRRTYELEIIKYYAALKTFNSFGRGWVHRVTES